MSADEKKKGRPARTGSVAPEDANLATWFHALWHRGEFPERVEVWQIFGKSKQVRGELVFHQDFKDFKELDVEQSTKLSNDVIAAAQDDCDARERKSDFQIAVVDRNRKANPLTKRLGPFMPKRLYLSSGDGSDDDDEDLRSGKSLALSYIKEAFEQVKWDKSRGDRNLGDLLLLQRETIREQRDWIDRMMGERMQFFAQLQDAEDRKLDRDANRNWLELKIALARDGIRTARNLLPGIFASAGDEAIVQARQDPQQASNAAATAKAPPSAEQALVDNFLHDCEDTGASVALFGDWVLDEAGRMTQTKPGIFTARQFAILVGVKERRLLPSAPLALVPDSGSPDAVTMEQASKAQPHLTEGTGMALAELMGLLKRRREAAQAAATDAKNDTEGEKKE